MIGYFIAAASYLSYSNLSRYNISLDSFCLYSRTFDSNRNSGQQHTS